MTQTEKILRHLRKYGSITSWEAITEYRITRLGAIIFELRKDGYIIDSTLVVARNKDGEPIKYARYTLDREVNNE